MIFINDPLNGDWFFNKDFLEGDVIYSTFIRVGPDMVLLPDSEEYVIKFSNGNRQLDNEKFSCYASM